MIRYLRRHVFVDPFNAYGYRYRCWRAPRWSPRWLRRAFPGCWTQEEVDDIKRRADDWMRRMEGLSE